MAQNTLYNKVFDRHKVRKLKSGEWQVVVSLHLIHEVTSPQAFSMIKERGLGVAHPERTFAVVDHIVPTDDLTRPFKDAIAEEMLQYLEKNCRTGNIEFFNLDTPYQGIVHVVAPELGLTQPGKLICCGDSHTATHGAFGALAFGIGTTQIAMVLASQSLALNELKVRQIKVNGNLQTGVYAKDVILKIISTLGIKAGLGFAYEYAGSTISKMSMEERMTICNMSIEGGALAGYINPDQVTIDYLRGRKYVPADLDQNKFDELARWWLTMASDKDAQYDDVVEFQAEEIEPMVTWGTNPGQAIGISQPIPEPQSQDDIDALKYMKFNPGEKIAGKKIDVVFIGSCTNGRMADLMEAVTIVKNRKKSPNTRALVVPGSKLVKQQAEARGLDQIFKQTGFEWREPGCSMCLAMNPDKLAGDQICASTSNRNYRGRQGSPIGRTILMSPAMAAGAAIAGKVVDVRELS